MFVFVFVFVFMFVFVFVFVCALVFVFVCVPVFGPMIVVCARDCGTKHALTIHVQHGT